MTGYGFDMFHIEDTTITVEIRTVNSRYLDFIPKIPRSLYDLESDIKDIIQANFHRGRIEVYISIVGNLLEQKKLNIDWKLLDQLVHHLNEMKKRYKIKGDIPFSVFTSIEDLISIQEMKVESNELRPLLLQSVEKVAGQVLSSRKSEGSFLLQDVLNRIKKIDSMLKLIEERKDDVYTHYRNRIQKRIKDNLGNAIEIDQIHLLQEVAILAEKGDIAEEILRLHSHLHQFELVVRHDNPVGRKLEFITQEMHREINTIGAKSVDAEISEWVVSIKSEIDKVKEQIQNIE